MNPQQKTLLVIALFVALILGSFIWFIVTWDPAQEEPVALNATAAAVIQA